MSSSVVSDVMVNTVATVDGEASSCLFPVVDVPVCLYGGVVFLVHLGGRLVIVFVKPKY